MKRTLSLIFAIFLCFGILPMSIGASDNSEGDNYVFEEIKEYRKGFTYLKNDGKLGIPAALTTYYKGEKSNADTPVALYVLGYVGARERKMEAAETILPDLLDEGYIVVTLDYIDHPLASNPLLDWSIQNIRINIKNYTAGLSYNKTDVYVVPDGYRIARNLVYFRLDEHATRGTIDYIIREYNKPDGSFRKAKLSKIPNPDEVVTTIDRCLKPDGTPIDLTLKMDIIYPSQCEEKAPVIMAASSSETRMSFCSTNKVRPLDVGPLMRGCAVAIYDHNYIPMSRNDHYGYYSNYSLMWYGALQAHPSAVRCVRYYADTFGYDKENYGVLGHSKASQCGILAQPHPEKMENWRSYPEGYDSFDTYGEAAFLSYEDGTPIPSGVSVAYHSMGDGSRYHTTFLASDNAPTMIACGVADTGGAWSYWEKEKANYEATGIEYLPIAMSDQGHTYPNGIDPEYGYDRWEAFMDFLMYHVKGDLAPRVLYTSVVGDRVIGDVTITRHNKEDNKTFSHSTVETGDEIFVQFLAPVTEESAKNGIELWDVTSGRAVKGSFRSMGGGNRWYFDVMETLVTGHKYELRVSGQIKSVLNGKAVGEDAVYAFTA